MPPIPSAAPPSREAQLDALFAELAKPGRTDWEQVEGRIDAIWSRSGSAAMDLLLKRGNDALEAEDYPTAVEHFSALVEMALKAFRAVRTLNPNRENINEAITRLERMTGETEL